MAWPLITFVGPVQAINGLGVSARGYVDALIASGASVRVEPWTDGFEHVNTQPVHFDQCDRGAINIIHLNLDLLSREGGLPDKPPLAGLMRGRYNILVPYWELASLRAEWLPLLTHFDEIWCASRFMQRTFAAVYRRPVTLVRPRITHAEPPLSSPLLPGLVAGRFKFFYAADMGSTFERKNPGLFWRAYAQEFHEREQASCVLKLHYSKAEHPEIYELQSVAEGRSDMHLILDSMSSEAMAALQRSTDCYVSPHRSEGLGLTLIEAMLAGKPVIATNYGGTADFISEESAFPIEHRLIEVGSRAGPYPQHFVWSDPVPCSLRRRMRQVFSNRLHAEAIAEAGRVKVEKMFGEGSISMIGAALSQTVDAWHSTHFHTEV